MTQQGEENIGYIAGDSVTEKEHSSLTNVRTNQLITIRQQRLGYHCSNLAHRIWYPVTFSLFFFQKVVRTPCYPSVYIASYQNFSCVSGTWESSAELVTICTVICLNLQVNDMTRIQTEV